MTHSLYSLFSRLYGVFVSTPALPQMAEIPVSELRIKIPEYTFCKSCNTPIVISKKWFTREICKRCNSNYC